MITSNEVKKSAKNAVRRIILGISIIAITISVAYLVNEYVIAPYKQRQTDKDTSISDESNTQTVPRSDNSEEVVQQKYSALLNMNPDFVGKLYIPAIEETGFNIVQTDNNSTYLTTGFKGETTRYGTLFVDYRNNIKSFDTNTIIYGHNMRDGSQLGSLSLYSDVKNYKAYPTLEFNTIYKNCTWKVFAAFIVNSDSDDDNGYAFPYLTPNFKSDEKFEEFIAAVKERSFYTNDAVDIKPGDKILTLSTCDTVFDGARFVLMARLVRNGESTEVDTSSVKVNDSPRYPQAWYDKKDKSNPYEDADNFTLD